MLAQKLVTDWREGERLLAVPDTQTRHTGRAVAD